VLGQNILILPGRGNAVRLEIEAAEPGVRLIVTFPDTGSILRACAVASAEAALGGAPAPACRSELPSGVREDLVSDGTARAVGIWVETGPAVTANIRLEYAEAGRRIGIRLPALRAPANPAVCKDNACNPFFEVRPVKGGPFAATATWSGGSARLALLEGRVLARSFSATGVPYAVAAADEGGSPAAVRTRLSAPAEYALVLDSNRENLSGIRIDAMWP
jgi:hypothetical protein